MIAINPPPSRFGRANAVLSARATRHESRFTGPLSVKGVIEGRATWETKGGRFELVAGSALVVNDGEEYAVEVDALQPVETFCLFFERGFVEEASRAAISGSATLLDTPAGGSFEICERLHFDDAVAASLRDAHATMRAGDALEGSFYEVAVALAESHASLAARVASLPALRSSTRVELARRIAIATSFLHANATRAVTIEEAAREACLSPFHFHRLFRALHGVTPHDYLRRLRLERAAALLASGLPVLDAALDCGFASVGSFTTLFRRTFRMTPGAFARTKKRARYEAATMRA
ncbi:MAG TPA: AraC family transcriptional regulator [Thermoanaerobaculia bacterium]